MGEPHDAVGTPRPLTRLRRDLTRRGCNERSATSDVRDTMTQPILAAAVAAILLACSGTADAAAPAASPEIASGDALEAFNRAMYGFNKGVVDYVINPTVDAVAPYTPAPVVTGLGNAYNNLTEIEYVLNGALRRDLPMAATAAGRFVVNSTVGIAGLFDVATPLGLARQKGDFGESMCAAGVPAGPYVVLPLVGPANVTSAGLLAGGVAVEVYLLSFISMALGACCRIRARNGIRTVLALNNL